MSDGQPPSTDDGLEQLRRQLEEVDQAPVAERVARFEQANEVLTRELAQLDELTSG